MTRLRYRWHDGYGGIVDQDQLLCESREEWEDQPESSLPGWCVAALGDGSLLALAPPPGLLPGRARVPATHAGHPG